MSGVEWSGAEWRGEALVSAGGNGLVWVGVGGGVEGRGMGGVGGGSAVCRGESGGRGRRSGCGRLKYRRIGVYRGYG